MWFHYGGQLIKRPGLESNQTLKGSRPTLVFLSLPAALAGSHAGFELETCVGGPTTLRSPSKPRCYGEGLAEPG